jgi:predicted acyltransferase
VVRVPGEGTMGAALLDQPARTIVAYVDRVLFDWSRWGLGNHLWASAGTWDPEGALSTLPSIATALLGVLCGRWILDPARPFRIRGLLLGGVVAAVAGWSWGLVFPLNKSLWSSSFVLFTAGIGAIVLAVLSAALERRPRVIWARPLIAFGENPLIAYAGSELARQVLHSSIKLPAFGRRLGVDEWTTRYLNTTGVVPNAASLIWSALFVAAWYAVLWRLSRRGFFLRV